MTILKYLQIPATQESHALVEKWIADSFPRGGIAPQYAERAVFQLAYDLWLPVFCSLATPSIHLVKPGSNEVPEGVSAWSRFVARGAVRECSKMFGSSVPQLTQDQVICGMMTFARSEFGDPSSDSRETFHAINLQNEAFLKRWLAVGADGKARTSQRYILALGWDGEIVPVRYFTNEAAASWVKFIAHSSARAKGSLFNSTDTYEKDVRGSRGLCLSQDKYYPAVVTEWHDNLVVIDRASAAQHALVLYPPWKYEGTWPGTRVRIT